MKKKAKARVCDPVEEARLHVIIKQLETDKEFFSKKNAELEYTYRTVRDENSRLKESIDGWNRASEMLRKLLNGSPAY